MRKNHAQACSMHTFQDSVHAGIDCFEGFLVNCLEACCQSETQQAGTGQADCSAIHPRLPEAAALQKTSAAPQRRVRLHVAQAAARPALLPKLTRKHDSGFSAPRVLAAPAPAKHAAPCMQQLQHSQQHGQQHTPELQPPQHRHLRQRMATDAADAKRKRRRSGLHRMCCIHACMHVRSTCTSSTTSANAQIPQLACGRNG